ncbi:NTF2-like protein [Trametes cingulata]|nr:NTF2-like protein [Trametes cingulata]
MPHLFPNAVASVAKPPFLVFLISQDQASWCQQFSEEGYSVILVPYPSREDGDLRRSLSEAKKELQNVDDWALVTYGFTTGNVSFAIQALVPEKLRALVHYSPVVETGDVLLHEAADGTVVPTLVHLSSKQETLHASLLALAAEKSTDIPTSRYPPIDVHAYPFIPASPPFPFQAGPPIDHASGKIGTIDPHLRSANNLSYTRTLELLRRELGPHFPLEALWEKHTYYEFVERDASKTMQTMVSTPYVNHVPTMTGGVGYRDLARFYKYHFTKDYVTPPDTELVTISRTIGADRIIEEMIYKCTHTTEIDYFLPGIKPTGKRLEIALVGVVAFRGDKLTFEHIYWDQASVLVQLGLLDSRGLPVAGVEVARKVVDPFGQPSNALLEKWKESEGLSID